MQISKKLPQFNNEKALIVVAAKQEAKFYIASNGQIDEISEFKIQKPKYSDRESFFAGIARGKIMGSGSGFEKNKNQKFSQEFEKEFTENIKKIFEKNGITDIYLVSSEPLKNKLEKEFPANMQSKIALEVAGNYLKFPVFKALEKIKQVQEGRHKKGLSTGSIKNILKIFRRK